MNHSIIRRIKKRERKTFGMFASFVLREKRNAIGFEINMGGDVCIDEMIYESPEGLITLLNDLINICKNHEIGRITAADVRDALTKEVLFKKGFSEKHIQNPYGGYFVFDVMKEGMDEMV